MPLNRVEGRWALYQALDPRMAVPRAVAVLQPPPGVTLTMREDTLVASGEAPTSWVREASLLWRTLPGVRQLDVSGIQNAELRGASRRLEAAMVQFVRGTPDLVPGQDEALGAMVAELRQLDIAARQAGRSPSRRRHRTHRCRRPGRPEPDVEPRACRRRSWRRCRVPR